MTTRRKGFAQKAGSCILALVFSLSMVPASAFAATGDYLAEGNGGATAQSAVDADGSSQDSYIEVAVDGTMTATNVMSVGFEWDDRSMTCNIGQASKTWDPQTMAWVYTYEGSAPIWTDTEATATVSNRSSLPIAAYVTSTPAEGVSITPEIWSTTGGVTAKTPLTADNAIEIDDATDGLEKSVAIGFTAGSVSEPTAIGTIRVPVTFYVNKRAAIAHSVTLSAPEGVSFTDASGTALASPVSVADGGTLRFKLAGIAEGSVAEEVTCTVAGTAFTLTADYDGVYTTPALAADAAVSVGVREAAPAVQGVSLNASAITLTDGEPDFGLVAHLDPADAAAAVTWTSSDPAVATVSDDGVVSAVAAGECTVTATATDAAAGADSGSGAAGATATCAVTVATSPKAFDFGTLGSFSLYELKNLGSEQAAELGINCDALVQDANGAWKIVTVVTGETETTLFASDSTAKAALTALVVPEDCVEIGKDAFAGCTALASVELPANTGYTAVANGVFKDCAALTSVSLPSNVTAIGEAAFSGCTALSDLSYGGSTAAWKNVDRGTDCFAGVPGADGCVSCTDGSRGLYPVTGLTLSATAESIEVGGTVATTATIAPASASIETVGWEVASGDGNCVSVSADGTVITGAAIGSVVLRPFVMDGSVKVVDATDEMQPQGKTLSLTVTAAAGGMEFTAAAGTAITLSDHGTAAGEDTRALDTLQYSTDGSTWQACTMGSAMTVGDEGKLYLKGNATSFATGSAHYASFSSTGDYSISSGSLEDLLAEGAGTDEALPANACESLFKDDVHLTGVPEGFLPFTELGASCYHALFSGCTKLSSVPVELLPAESLTASCYSSMFAGCSELNTVIGLPASELQEGCYQDMFASCTSLTDPATLSAGTLASDCYNGMYASSGLTKTPDLPASVLSPGCYSSMFEGCSALTSAGSIPKYTATSFTYNSANDCMKRMFADCTTLKIGTRQLSDSTKTGHIVNFSDGSFGETYCSEMFSGTTSGSFTAGTPASGYDYYWYV